MSKKRAKLRNYSDDSALFMRRTIVAFVSITLAIILLITNLYYLQIKSFKSYQTRSNSNRISVQTIVPNRGLIFDRNGVILAENRPVFSLKVVTKKVKGLDLKISQLKKLLNLTDKDVKRFNDQNRYSRAFKPITLKEQLTIDQVAIFTVNQHTFKGFSIEADLKRFYPFGDSLTHALGYIAKINSRDLKKIKEKGEGARYRATNYIGKLGIEKHYEDLLHGEPGRRQVEVDSWGKIIRTLEYTPPIPGKDLTLNIDIRLQLKAQKLLKKRRGSIVIMDPHTGGVLAMVSSPSYDPNLFVQGISRKKYKGLLKSKELPLINRATQGRYSPASTIKPQMALLALNTGVITEKTKILDPGWWKIPNTERKFRDWKKWGHGKVDVHDAIMQSCDTFFYDASYKIGIDNINPFMRQFGFGQFSGLDVAEETKAIMPSRAWKKRRFNKPWYDGDTISIGIGQGYWTVTPIQLAKATSILANRGKKIIPQILMSIDSKNGSVTTIDKEVETIKLDDLHYWDVALDAMHSVTSGKHGTARRAFYRTPYTTAGKSGTAQVINMKEDEEYDAEKINERHRDNAMFVAFAPFKKTEIVATVIIENAGGGSSHAAPVARKLFDEYFKNKKKDNSKHKVGM